MALKNNKFIKASSLHELLKQELERLHKDGIKAKEKAEGMHKQLVSKLYVIKNILIVLWRGTNKCCQKSRIDIMGL